MTRFVMALSALAIGAVAGAQTQTLPDLEQAARGFGFRIGGFFPADNKLRDFETTWTDVGIEYDLERSMVKNGTTYLAFDWTSKGFFGGVHSMQFSFNQRFYGGTSRYSGGGAPYFYLGAGGQWTDFAGETGSSWLLRGGVGTELNNGWFAEAGGVVTPKISGASTSGISLSIGYKFK